uniref:ER membrane protein complex subunit 2 n=1 Tax=Chrysotila carterae TaxID=13221 RepID=A0A7S4B6H6_CHRCT
MTFKAAWISVYRLMSAFWPSVWPLCCRSEAGGELEAAMQKYEDILKQDPNNLYAMKRQVALLRGRGRYAEAARRLVDHLAVVCSDAEAWLQLADLYLLQQQYKKAAFCMEELILLNPMNYMYHVRYGEILFTLYGNERGGNAEQVRTARKYFAHALELKPSGNLRALYGLLLCCAAAGKGSKGRDVAELVAFAKQTLTEAYADAKSPMLTLVKSMIETLLT